MMITTQERERVLRFLGSLQFWQRPNADPLVAQLEALRLILSRANALPEDAAERACIVGDAT